MLLQIFGWREHHVRLCILAKFNPAAPASGYVTNSWAGWINE